MEKRKPLPLPPRLWLGGTVAIALVAFRDLIQFDPQATREVEEWFFVPSDTAPPLVMLFAGWLVYRRAHLLELGRRAPRGAAVLYAIAFAVQVWALAFDAPDLQAIAAGALLLGTGLLLAGRSGARALWVPALFLLFSMPLPAPLLTELVWKFQLWTAWFSGWLLYQLSIPSYVSGDLIFRSHETFQVIETCSGLRSVETLSMLTVVMIDLFRRRGWHAAILMGLAPPVAFGLNGLRVLTLILNPHSTVAAIHNLQGVLVLMAGLLLLYAVDGQLARILPAPRPRPAGGQRVPLGRLGPRLATATGACVVLAVLSFAVPRMAPSPTSLPSLDDYLAVEVDGWRLRAELPTDRVFLQRVGFRESLYRRYRRPPFDSEVTVFIGVGDHSRRTRTPFSPKTALPGSGWMQVAAGRRVVGPDRREVDWAILRRDTQWRLVYHWYEGSAGVWSEALRALLGLDAGPWRRERDGLVMRLSTPISALDEASRTRARRILGRFYPTVRRAIDAYRAAIPQGNEATPAPAAAHRPAPGVATGLSHSRKTFSQPASRAELTKPTKPAT